MTATSVTDPGAFAVLDDSKITRFQYKIMFISGMGFFTDAYDLFIIGIVVSLLRTEWHLSTGQQSLLNSATLAASAVGAIVFGRIAEVVPSAPVPIVTYVAEGDPAEVLDTVSQRVAATAPCPVVLVKPPR